MELYLSRIILNPSSKAVLHDLGSPREMHKSISRCFPAIEAEDAKLQAERQTPRNAYKLLHRLDQRGESFVLYVQSTIKPDWNQLSPGYATRFDDKKIDHLYGAIENGDRLQFRLAANPTKRAGKKDEGHAKFRDERKRRRLDIRTEEGRINWLGRKGEACGFKLCDVRSMNGIPAVQTSLSQPIAFSHEKGRVTLGNAVFEGLLEVTDADAFRNAIANGIGPGKAYGFGLMSVARA